MPWFDWISLFARWFHVIAGVAWIGASFYFIWLDNNLRTPPDWKKEKGIKGDLWAVHGGGFYEVAKYAYGPAQIPEKLHWFKWEAYTTWLSGFFLLGLVYYHGASIYLIDASVMQLSVAEAIARGLGLIFGGLFIYEAACRSPLGRSPVYFAVFLLALITLASYLACHWFSGRGAFMHVGALIGTIMAGNVFFKIMPAQRLMVNAVANKGEIDPAWGEAAKLRSVHNNYFTLPLLFIMISNHYPMTYQHELNWLILVAIGIVSAWIRHYFNLKHIGISRPSVLITGAIGMVLIALWVSMPRSEPVGEFGDNAARVNQVSAPVLTEEQQEVFDIIQTHCANCHGANPTDDIFVVAPLGLMLDNWQQVEARAPLIYQRAAVSKDMPLMNKTAMTEDERQVIARWFTHLQP
ncbi:MAG: urate hydroxylase PuuD [Paraglaciecola sp.]|uniref:urate hydroxylase PuuD n=1 Tax=Paraglaciecola sp. TaxID=1920173 RepID=UPI00273D7C54|nr:urate hydroxylase PuuD [Paraglaciecola sp.]MDP5031613.1 urate hydroxylase PuuD [Paraglaciecola sp.]MDP5131264.1 urate hydroxylase PuuD [Paraglaciecola sp.]